MARNGYTIEHDLTGGEPRAIFVFHGRGETSFGPELREQVSELIAMGFRAFEMDLRAVESCDSISLGTFVGIQAAVRRTHGTLSFTLRAHTHIRDLFAMLNLDRVLTVREVQTPHRTPQHAVRTVRVPSPRGRPAREGPRQRAAQEGDAPRFEAGLPTHEDRPEPDDTAP
jgi:anti-anti-sigma factor